MSLLQGISLLLGCLCHQRKFQTDLELHLLLNSSRKHNKKQRRVIHLLTGFCFCFFRTFSPTFRRIVRNRSTEQFSGLPYIYALLNCLITLWYGTPIVSSDNIMVMTVNSIGAVFQMVYIVLFIVYAEKSTKVDCFT